MRKIFTLAAALLASFGLWADEATFTMSNIFSDTAYPSVEVTDPVPATVNTTTSKSNAKNGKLGSDGNYFEIILAEDTYAAASINGYINTSTTEGKNWGFQFSTDGGATWSEEEMQANDGDKSAHDIAVVADIPAGANGFRVVRHAGTSTVVNSITLTLGCASTDPVLKVNPAEVELNASAKNPVASATVVFSGKNLEPGSYALTVPDLLGLGIEPTVVEVGENGKLNAEVTLSFSSAEDVEAASTAISLTIGELTQEVTIHYSAAMTVVKNFLNTSLNIEQWVLDNGKDTAAVQEVLRAANVDFENINELDSLNSSKTADNEPYLGLKLKKAGAYVACWIKAGDRIALKFGALKDAVKIGVNGEYRELPANDNGGDIIEHTAEVDEYIEVVTKSDKTIVIKQIMLNQDIQPVVLPTEGIEDVEASAIRSQKVFRNGHLLIENNGVIYNAQGTIVK